MKNYKAFWDGKEIVVYPATVSAQRFNRIWSGKQRTKDQTETAYYVDFDFDKTATLKIIVEGEPIERVEIRPLYKKYKYAVNGNQIEIEVKEAGHFSVEINGYHEALAVFVNPPESYEPRKNDIYFGPGEHDVGLILPDNGQRVYIDRGAIVHGVVYAIKKTGVSVEGRGVLDASKYLRPSKMEHSSLGSEELFSKPWDESQEKEVEDVLLQLKGGYSSLILRQFKEKGLAYRYNCPMGIVTAYGCTDMKISGVILKDSFFWTLILRNACDNILIDNVKIIGQWRYNTDGINICDSNNVTVKNCFIRSFDDCIVVRGGYGASGYGYGCHNICIENNVCWCDWGKVFEIWSGDCNSEIENVMVKNNYAIRISYIVFSIDMRYGCDSTVVNNIKYNNIYIEYDDVQEMQQLQKTDEQKYDSTKIGRNEFLLFIGAGPLGKNLGDQRLESIENKQSSVVYKNIVLENIHENKPYGEVLLKRECITELSNIILRGQNLCMAFQ